MTDSEAKLDRQMRKGLLGLAALSAARHNQLQRAVNICLGSALATIGLTVPAVLAAAFAFVPNQGDAWASVLDALVRHMEGADLFEAEMAGDAEAPIYIFPLAIGELAGRRTAEMHRALAQDGGNPAFTPEPVTGEDAQNMLKLSDVLDDLDTIDTAGFVRTGMERLREQLNGPEAETARRALALLYGLHQQTGS